MIINSKTKLKKIIIAPDSFKGSLTSRNAAEAIKAGISKALGKEYINSTGLTFVTLPLADGGEGTLDAIVDEECRYNTKIRHPHKDVNTEMTATWGFIRDVAIIEMASACGLTLIDDNMRDPRYTTTYGVGQLILAALQSGFRKFMLTVGGSSTNDGGAGLLCALGARFIDDFGNEILPFGKDLYSISEIDLSLLDKRLLESEFTIACDVNNPLLGPSGATRVYGPQKGANTEEILTDLEAGLAKFSHNLKLKTGKSFENVPGCGAGGGIPLSILSVTNNSRIVSGIDTVLDTIGFNEHLLDCDLIISGEGRVDGQSASGKLISGLAKRSYKKNIPLVVFAGSLSDGYELLYNHGVSQINSIISSPMSLQYAMDNAYGLLSEASFRFIKNNYN